MISAQRSIGALAHAADQWLARQQVDLAPPATAASAATLALRSPKHQNGRHAAFPLTPRGAFGIVEPAMNDYQRLKTLIARMSGVVVAYSGGVDSTLLAKAATDALGIRAVCVLIESCLVPGVELEEAISQAEELGLHLVRLPVDVLEVDGVQDNEPDRCYHCKRALFTKLVDIARQRDFPYVIDGSNADDEDDFRPGSRALVELAVRSPFKELGYTKEQIRAISREIGLPTWNKPSYACLASRVPYGTELTEDVLGRVELAEQVIRSLGFSQFRVRHHGDIARIEVLPADMERLNESGTRDQVVRALSEIGYNYVTLDLAGYRTGSMNEVLGTEN